MFYIIYREPKSYFKKFINIKELCNKKIQTRRK